MSTAVMFPGQGSQKVGMMAAVADLPGVRQTFDTCSEAIGEDLWKLAAEGPEDQLNLTENTQPALLAASVSLYRLWAADNPAPDLVAGHSLGEYSALVAADCLDLEDAARLVRRRGQLMQQAVEPGQGAMAAILSLDDDEVEDCCRQAAEITDQVVAPANYNCLGQVVIAGQSEAVRTAGELCAEQGARRVIPLAVSVPSHCALMRGAAEELAADLKAISWRAPGCPLVQNVSAMPSQDPDEIVANLQLQLYRPVRWKNCVDKLVELGADLVLESGPGQVLTGLAKKINKSLQISGMEKIILEGSGS